VERVEIYVAEAKEGIVLIPRLRKIAKVEVEVAIRVGIHVRHPTIEAVTHTRKLIYDVLSLPHQKRHQLIFEFYSESYVVTALASTSHRRIYFFIEKVLICKAYPANHSLISHMRI
jgi:hypothetical protein